MSADSCQNCGAEKYLTTAAASGMDVCIDCTAGKYSAAAAAASADSWSVSVALLVVYTTSGAQGSGPAPLVLPRLLLAPRTRGRALSASSTSMLKLLHPHRALHAPQASCRTPKVEFHAVCCVLD